VAASATANIASEILTRPGIIFLDEPNQRARPSAAADLIDGLHRMAEPKHGCVHDTQRRGHSAKPPRGGPCAGRTARCVGTPTEVLRRVGVASFADMYTKLAALTPAPRQSRHHRDTSSSDGIHAAPPTPRRPPGAFAMVDAHKTVGRILTRNRLTVAILLGSPLPSSPCLQSCSNPAGSSRHDRPTAAVTVAYWLAFAGSLRPDVWPASGVHRTRDAEKPSRYAGVRIGGT